MSASRLSLVVVVAVAALALALGAGAARADGPPVMHCRSRKGGLGVRPGAERRMVVMAADDPQEGRCGPTEPPRSQRKSWSEGRTAVGAPVSWRTPMSSRRGG
jgi:hypothetical protein